MFTHLKRRFLNLLFLNTSSCSCCGIRKVLLKKAEIIISQKLYYSSIVKIVYSQNLSFMHLHANPKLFLYILWNTKWEYCSYKDRTIWLVNMTVCYIWSNLVAFVRVIHPYISSWKSSLSLFAHIQIYRVKTCHARFHVSDNTYSVNVSDAKYGMMCTFQ